jgi:hypothetical protein
MDEPAPNERTPSTRAHVKRVKIGPSAERQGNRRLVEASSSRRESLQGFRRRWKGLEERRARDWLTIRVRYRGGATAVVEVEGRGRRGLFDGDHCIFDVIAEVNQMTFGRTTYGVDDQWHPPPPKP